MNFGPIYINTGARGLVYYTLAPHGTVIRKAPGVTTWVRSAMSKELFEMHIKSGQLVKR